MVKRVVVGLHLPDILVVNGEKPQRWRSCQPASPPLALTWMKTTSTCPWVAAQLWTSSLHAMCCKRSVRRRHRRCSICQRLFAVHTLIQGWWFFAVLIGRLYFSLDQIVRLTPEGAYFVTHCLLCILVSLGVHYSFLASVHNKDSRKKIQWYVKIYILLPL